MRYLDKSKIIFFGLFVFLLILTINFFPGKSDNNIIPDRPSPVELIPEKDRKISDWVLLGAREEVNNGTTYDASYVTIKYPGGDVLPGVGACTDVIIRAFRNAGIDLQQAIHEDISAYFNEYPNLWGLASPDSNIDHRRVPNQMKFFERHGVSLPKVVNADSLDTWQWGDIVYWRFPNGLEHCGVISDKKNIDGVPLVIHNGGIAREENCLSRWQIIGHFRYPIN